MDVAAFRSSGLFDERWYLDTYPDVAALSMDAAEHYLWLGKRLGRIPSPHAPPPIPITSSIVSADSLTFRSPFTSFGVIKHNPLISILVVSFNSGKDLEILFPSIADQTYKNFEVVLIENGTENTEPLLERYFDKCRYMRADNVGFAEGNNIALQISSGELVALINPDTRLDSDMLQSLLDAMRFDNEAAVAVPKINFFDRFIRLTVSSHSPFSVASEELVAGLDYRKFFVRQGSLVDQAVYSDDNGTLVVDLPCGTPRTIKFTLCGTSGPLSQCRTQLGYSKHVTIITDPSKMMDIELAIDSLSCSSARYIVNNAGSGLHSDGTPYDRGYAQIDDGEFFSKAYVEAMCGCAALIRRAALIERELFIPSFFAYFEDSELSHWLRAQGFRILYQPESIVFHRHSESTEEDSVLWNVLVNRSRLLYEMAIGRNALRAQLFEYSYPKDFDHPILPKLINLDNRVRSSNELAELVTPKRPTACVYNTYFSSMGGGEKHALDIANLLSEKYDVYIASEEDFSLEELEIYFLVDLTNVRKLICNTIDEYFTSKFDLFVNSTYRSNIHAQAKRNLYIVSFPHPDMDKALIKNTTFIPNSHFTAGWSDQYWGEHDRKILLPIIGQRSLFENQELINKTQSLLSVGRFTSEGHCKNHHHVIRAYRSLADRQPALGDWKLRIVGSCNFADEPSRAYLELLRNLAEGYNVEILPNLSRDALIEIYRENAIYVHATGLGLPKDLPERHEHFGITTFEAMAYGCIPVVYAEGGPVEQVKGLDFHFVFRNDDELMDVLELAIQQNSQGSSAAKQVYEYSRKMFHENYIEARSFLLGERSM